MRYTAYDAAGRLTELTLPDGTRETYTYTPDGLTAAVSATSGTTRYEFDPLTRLPVRVTQSDGSYVRYAYDQAGASTLVAHAPGAGSPEAATGYAYDALGRLVEVADSTGATTRYSYDAASNASGVALPNGTTASATHDALNRLTSLVHRKADGTVLASFGYTLDALGNRTAVAHEDASRITYVYDATARLTAERHVASDGAVVADASYTYDAVGNVLSQSGSVGNIAYSYNVDDQVIAAGGATYAYDGAGNQSSVTRGGETTRYSYDARGRLLRVQPASGGATDFTYDHEGTRQSKTGPSGTVRYLVDRFDRSGVAQVVRETDGSGATLRTYTRGLSLLEKTEAGATGYYHTDGLGSTALLTDASGTVTDRYSYTAYGISTGTPSTRANSYQFAGEQQDAESGLYYLRARFYDPALGRFLSRDPAAGDERQPLTLHRYLYANANPANVVDPTGRFGEFDFGSMLSFASADPTALFNLGRPSSKSVEGYGAKYLGPTAHLKLARDLAQGLIDGAILRNEIGEDLETYFGTPTPARRKRVAEVLFGMQSLVRSPMLNFELDLAKEGPDIAYVNPNDGEIRVFWTSRFINSYKSDKTGMETARELAHELSHEVGQLHNGVKGTDDIVVKPGRIGDDGCVGDDLGRCYGKRNAKWLATYQPDQAVNNADNYSFYVVAP